MAGVETTTTKWKVDITEFKSAMSEADRAIKLAASEFKVASSELGKWGDSTAGVSAKLTQLDKVLEAQERKAAALREEYARVAKEQGEDSKAAEELKIKLNNQESAVNKTKNEITYYNKKLDELETANKEGETALSKLTDEIEDQEKELKDLKKQYTNIVLEQGEESEAAKDVAKKIETLSGELSDNKKKLSDAEKAADGLGDELEDTAKDAKTASDGFTVFKGTLANLAADAIKKVVSGLKDLGKAAIDAYKEFDEGQDNVIKATGATGEAAQQLTTAYKNVTKSVLGDLGDIGSALGEVSTRFGFTGAQLEEATEQFVKFAEITGTDATSAVRSVSRAMEKAEIPAEEYGEVLDALAVAGQASGISVDTLAESLTTNGTAMKSIGLNTKQSIAMLAQFEKAGVNSSVAVTGLRKAFVTWTNSGKDARTELNKVIESIKKAPSSTEAARIAIENFGSKAGPELADAISTGRFEYQEFLDLIEGSAGTVNATYNETIDGFDRVNLAIQGMKSDLGDVVGGIFTEYQPEIEGIIDAISDGLQTILTGAINVVDFALNNLPLIKAALAGIVGFSIAKKISSISGMIAALLPNATGLISIISNPAFAAIAATIAAITTAIIAYNIEAGKGSKEIQAFRKENEELQKSLGEISDKYSAFADNLKSEAENIEGSFLVTEHLWDRLSELVDANGKVTTGKEKEAQIIIDQLNTALGTELELVNGQIDGYGKLAGQIDAVIEKKKLESLVNVYQDDYARALSEVSSAELKLSEAEETLTRNKELQAQKEQELLELTRQRNISNDADAANQHNLIKRIGQVKREYDEINATVAESQRVYDEASTAVGGYNALIENYQGAQAAYAEGNADAIEAATVRLQYNLESAATGTKDSLKAQMKEYDAYYKRMEKAYESGKITERQMKDAEAAAKYTREQYELSVAGLTTTSKKALTEQIKADNAAQKQHKLSYKSINDIIKQGSKEAEDEAKKGGSKSGAGFSGGFISGIAGMNNQAKTAGVNIAKAAVDASNTGKEGFKKSGTESGTQFAQGITSQKSAASTSGKSLSAEGATGAGSVDWRTKAVGKANEFASALASPEAKATAKANAKGISEAAQSGLGSIDMTGTAKKALTQYNTGLKDGSVIENVKASAKKVAEAANGAQGFGAVSAVAKGQAMSGQFAKGISDAEKKKAVKANAANVSAEAEKSFGAANATGQGKARTAEFGAGINDGQTVEGAKRSAVSALNTVLTGFNTDRARTLGENIMLGIKSGLANKAEEVARSFEEQVNNVIKRGENIAQVKSPSRRTMWLGEMMAEGLAIGLEDTAPIKSAASMVDGIIDLIDGAKAGMAAASGAFGASNVRRGGVQASAGSVKNITYNQYNSSPKALSRLEIYQQTQRQLIAQGGI